MAKLGRRPIPHPRRRGVFVRFSDAEWGALEQALVRDHAVASRRATVPEWIRDLVVAHASEILGVEITRAALRPRADGVPDWKRWQLARGVGRAARRRREARSHPLRGAPKTRLGAKGRSATLRGAPSRLPLATALEPDRLTASTTKKKRRKTKS
jgi:hypothetical protein